VLSNNTNIEYICKNRSYL